MISRSSWWSTAIIESNILLRRPQLKLNKNENGNNYERLTISNDKSPRITIIEVKPGIWLVFSLPTILSLLSDKLASLLLFASGPSAGAVSNVMCENSKTTAVLHQLDQKIIYPHYDFKHLTEKYFEIGMKLNDFSIQLVKYWTGTFSTSLIFISAQTRPLDTFI